MVDEHLPPYPLTVDSLAEQFAACGLQQGQMVIVHSALSSLGYVIGGPVAVIQALLGVVGPRGTIIMPTQTWKNLDPNSGVYNAENIPESWWSAIREYLPAYDPAITPSVGMGVIAETLRTWPGAKRSLHPVRSFVAVGQHAAFLVADHALEDPFGETSPLGKLYASDGLILLIGVDHHSNTSLHLAEERANYPGKRYIQESSAILISGTRQWVTYRSRALDQDADFTTIGSAYEAAHDIRPCHVGLSEVRLLRQRPLIDWAVPWMEQHRTAPDP